MSGVTVFFECGGCSAKTQPQRLSSRFQSMFGDKGWGFGHWVNQKPEDVAPEGWVAFDPYTRCTYCPDCWKEIEGGAGVSKPIERKT